MEQLLNKAMKDVWDTERHSKWKNTDECHRQETLNFFFKLKILSYLKIKKKPQRGSYLKTVLLHPTPKVTS